MRFGADGHGNFGDRMTKHPEPEDPFAEKAGWFDQHYDTTRGRVRFRVLREQLREVLPSPPADILDAGGGTGRFAAALADDGYRVTLLDPSRSMLERAEAALDPYAGNSRILPGRAEEARSLFGPGSFDAVLLHAVICYLEDPESILSSVAAVLKQGGALSVVFKNRDALPFRHAAQGRIREAARVLEDPLDAGDLGIVNRARTRGEVEEALARTGFEMRRAYGVRVFADLISEELEEEDAVEALVALELRAARLEPYRSVARLYHLVGERRCAHSD